jgi:hypothetical protein
LKSLKTKIGIEPIATAANGITACLGITESNIKAIARKPNPNQEMVATSRKLLTYFSGVTDNSAF